VGDGQGGLGNEKAVPLVGGGVREKKKHGAATVTLSSWVSGPKAFEKALGNRRGEYGKKRGGRVMPVLVSEVRRGVV